MRPTRDILQRFARDESGLTLIEIGITLLIVGILMLGVMPAIESVTGTRARETAGKLTGLVRYMYNESALSGRPCRMTFDLDKRMYWAECAEGHFVLEAEREKAHEGAKLDERVKSSLDAPSSPDQAPADPNDPDAKSLTNGFDDDFNFDLEDPDQIKLEKQRIDNQTEFQEFTSDEVEKTTLPQNVELSMWVDHQREKYIHGKAYLYFFPEGYTERALIFVKSGTYVYSIKVAPLTGKAVVVPSELEIPKDLE